MKRLELRVRQLSARGAFQAGTFEARLEAIDADGLPTGTVVFTTRNHTTWASAADVALAKADRKAWVISNRALVARRIANDVEHGS
jgi:hypothetical protein